MASQNDLLPAVVLAEDDEAYATSSETLAPALLENLPVPALKTLLQLRKQGWQDKYFDGAFAEQRANARDPDQNAEKYWFLMMKNALREMNGFASFIPSSGYYKFLDLGCCPGGFSSYVLSSNPDARGVGLSLPEIQGGHEYLLEYWLRPRMKLNWVDLTYYKLHPSADQVRGKLLEPLPDACKDFDLVILDGHYLRDLYVTPLLAEPEAWDRQRLHVSQMIIALKAVKMGGSILIKLSHPEWTVTAQTLYLLDVLSTELKTYKPRRAHANRGTFYAIAKGVGYGPKGSLKEEYLRQYQEHWYDISLGGEEGKGRQATWSDMSFVASYEELADGYLERVAELGNDPWTVQSNALKRMLARTGGNDSHTTNGVATGNT